MFQYRKTKLNYYNIKLTQMFSITTTTLRVIRNWMSFAIKIIYNSVWIHMPTDVCVLAISSVGKRCVLEKYKKKIRVTEYQCRTSMVVVGSMSEYIEIDDYVKACGVDRKMVGISSDNLMEPQFTSKLCSPSCYNHCPNIIDLYFKLAEGEGPDCTHGQVQTFFSASENRWVLVTLVLTEVLNSKLKKRQRRDSRLNFMIRTLE